MNYLNLEDYDFTLPEDRIAKRPAVPRDHSRLLVVDRKSGAIYEKPFFEIEDFFSSSDCLVTNNTKVLKARLIGKKQTGGKAECLLLKPISEFVWESIVKPGKKIVEGTRLIFSSDFEAEVLEVLPNGNRILEFSQHAPFETNLKKYGKLPLPSYINRGESTFSDEAYYQTVYAKENGAAAAPTAGLHFTEELLRKIQNKGVNFLPLTLHVGLGTFRPVKEADIRNHTMHEESYKINDETALKLNHKKGCLFAVGTTSLRALESNVLSHGKITSGCFDTSIFIYPGFEFKCVDHLLTNFHLPKSTLLMLVSAFGGYELIKEAYSFAIHNKFRFYSYGDAMLIL